MGLICKLSGHKWNGCKCERCGETRNEQHDWSTCKCSKCGRTIEIAQIKEITDQTILFNIAITAPKINTAGSVQSIDKAISTAVAAVMKMTDQHLLADIAKRTYITAGIQAMKRITDHSLLIDIMEDDRFNDFWKVKDLFPNACADIAKNRKLKQDKRVSAFSCIKDKSVFTADELKELEELKSLQDKELHSSISVNTLPTQSWEYS